MQIRWRPAFSAATVVVSLPAVLFVNLLMNTPSHYVGESLESTSTCVFNRNSV
jgi:hypothetical protein